MPVAANSNGWSREGSRPTWCVFGARAVAVCGALMSTFITELWPCAVHSCPLLSQSCGHAQCTQSTFTTELWPCAVHSCPLLSQSCGHAQWHSHPLIPDGGAGCRLHCCQMKQAHCRSCCQRPDGGSGLLMKHLLLLLPAAETTGQEDGKGVG